MIESVTKASKRNWSSGNSQKKLYEICYIWYSATGLPFVPNHLFEWMNDNMHLVDDVVGLEIGGQREIVIKYFAQNFKIKHFNFLSLWQRKKELEKSSCFLLHACKKVRSIVKFWLEKLICFFFHSFHSWRKTEVRISTFLVKIPI